MSTNGDELISISISPINNSSTTNSQQVYQLPYPIKLNGYDIALSSLQIYNSIFNITAAYGDNLLQYNFPGASSNPYTVFFPDGSYSISDIGNFIQFVMQQNGHYLVDSAGNNVYYISLVPNAAYYAVTVTCTPVPASLPAGWSNPNNITLSGQTPQLIIPNPTASATYTMNQLLGFQSGTYPASPQSTIYQINSNGQGAAGVPQISPVTAWNVNVNWVQSSNFNPNPQTIMTFVPTVSTGELINVQPLYPIWLKCMGTQFPNLVVSFTDQNGLPLNLKDGNITSNFYLRKTSGVGSQANGAAIR
jgi:hypothetical protein